MKGIGDRIKCPQCHGRVQLLIGRLIQGADGREAYLACWSCMLHAMVRGDDVSHWARFREAPNGDADWIRHSRTHWTRIVDGDDLHYWPTTGKFRFRGETRTGDVEAFLRDVA